LYYLSKVLSRVGGTLRFQTSSLALEEMSQGPLQNTIISSPAKVFRLLAHCPNKHPNLTPVCHHHTRRWLLAVVG